MELFNFYSLSKPEELIVPIVRNERGYGIFYWYIDSSGNIGSRQSYFENNKNFVSNLDRDHFGSNKLEKVNKSEYRHLLISSFFDKDETVFKKWGLFK